MSLNARDERPQLKIRAGQSADPDELERTLQFIKYALEMAGREPGGTVSW
jgi:hypothetical protein